MPPSEAGETWTRPYVNYIEALRGEFQRVQGSDVVVHAAGLYEGPGDDRVIARCHGRFHTNALSYPDEETLVTCLWCIAERDGYDMRW
jgi:hypothetical protein